MRKRTEAAWKKCPKCRKIENQVKAGYNASGSQRCRCKECGIYYTIDPKRHAYPERNQRTGYQNVLRRNQWAWSRKDTGNKQVQCDELDKKRPIERKVKQYPQWV